MVALTLANWEIFRKIAVKRWNFLIYVYMCIYISRNAANFRSQSASSIYYTALKLSGVATGQTYLFVQSKLRSSTR